MSGDRTDGPTEGRLRRTLGLAAVGVVVLVVVVAGVVSTRDGEQPAAGGGTSASASADDTPEPTASGTATTGTEPSPSASPSDEPGAAATATPPEPVAGATPGPDGRPVAPPVALDAPAAPRAGIEVRLASIEAVEGEANLPGEIGGPSLRVTVTVTNAGTEAADLTGAVVNLYTGPDRVPAVTLMEPGAEPFPADVAPGAQASGRFVFQVPLAQRSDVTIEVDLATDATVLLFSGDVGV